MCAYVCVCVFVLAGNRASSKLPKVPRIGSDSVVAGLPHDTGTNMKMKGRGEGVGEGG